MLRTLTHHLPKGEEQQAGGTDFNRQADKMSSTPSGLTPLGDPAPRSRRALPKLNRPPILHLEDRWPAGNFVFELRRQLATAHRPTVPPKESGQ